MTGWNRFRDRIRKKQAQAGVAKTPVSEEVRGLPVAETAAGEEAQRELLEDYTQATVCVFEALCRGRSPRPADLLDVSACWLSHGSLGATPASPQFETLYQQIDLILPRAWECRRQLTSTTP